MPRGFRLVGAVLSACGSFRRANPASACVDVPAPAPPAPPPSNKPASHTSPNPRLHCACPSPAVALCFTCSGPSVRISSVGSSLCVVQSPSGVTLKFKFPRAAAAPAAPALVAARSALRRS